MTTIRASISEDVPALLDIWRRSVLATHDFLTADDFTAIEVMVAGDYLPNATFWVAVDGEGRPIGFMGLSDAHLDALFIDPDRRGGGIGRRLVDHAPEIVTVDVNEQNPQAIGFYERLGFRTIDRSPLDDAGRPYPILHMRRG